MLSTLIKIGLLLPFSFSFFAAPIQVPTSPALPDEARRRREGRGWKREKTQKKRPRLFLGGAKKKKRKKSEQRARERESGKEKKKKCVSRTKGRTTAAAFLFYICCPARGTHSPISVSPPEQTNEKERRRSRKTPIADFFRFSTRVEDRYWKKKIKGSRFCFVLLFFSRLSFCFFPSARKKKMNKK